MQNMIMTVKVVLILASVIALAGLAVLMMAGELINCVLSYPYRAIMGRA